MNPEANEAFEKGKQLLDSNSLSEAISAFARAVKLSPDDAECRAWYAQSLIKQNRYDEAIEESNRAIGFDPNSAKAYRQLGYAQLAKSSYSVALKNLSKAIEIEPSILGAYESRAKIHDALGNFEDAIADRARCFLIDSNREPGKWSGKESKFEPWYQGIHNHLMRAVWPKLRASDEKFVEYWPCYMEWGKRSEVRSRSNRIYTMTFSSNGSGYLCLTNKNIYLFSLSQVSKQFSLYNQGVNQLLKLIDLTNQSSQLEKSDKFWSIPYLTLAGAQIADMAIKLVTAAMTWEIYEHFTGHLQVMMAGINAGLSGKFSTKVEVPTSQLNITNKEDVISLLQQLAVLKSQGILSEVEFEQKKKELLGRL